MSKISRLLLLVLLASFVSPAFAFDDPVAPAVSNINAGEEETAAPAISSSGEIKNALMGWAAALSAGSPDAINALYTENAVLLPTLSPEIITTPEARKAYFSKLMKRKNLRVTLQQAQVRGYGDMAVASGLYTFSYTEHGKEVAIPARFSFVYKKAEDGRLMIIEHHSSRLPKG